MKTTVHRATSDASPDESACPFEACDYRTYSGHRMHDHLADEHALIDRIMDGEVVIHE